MIVKTQFGKIKEILVEKYSPENELISRACLIIRERPDNQGKMAMLEDVWTNEKYRNQGFASEILKNVIEIAKKENVYKIVLQCKTSLVDWYAKFGWNTHQNAMRLDING